MKTIIAALAALSLCSCSTVAGGSGSQLADALKAIATDPNCGHTDRVSGNLGGLTGGNLNVFLERTCPAKAASPAAP